MSKIKELLSEALVCDKTEFVKLLFTQGVPAKDYLTVATLRQLYNTVCIRHKLHDTVRICPIWFVAQHD